VKTHLRTRCKQGRETKGNAVVTFGFAERPAADRIAQNYAVPVSEFVRTPTSLRLGLTGNAGKSIQAGPDRLDGDTDSSLTKIGSGTLTLSGANAYTGRTLINAGILYASQTARSAWETLALPRQAQP
jgi:autotransporter-associated beta strand protein